MTADRVAYWSCYLVLSGVCLYVVAAWLFWCRRCGRFRPLHKGLCYTCRNHLFRRSRM